jgi:redox-sensitive bicupin YhaK (pirin superfamily)
MRHVAMPVIARLQRANQGSHFRAFGLRGTEVAKLIDPFLGVDHAWMSGPTFPPHPHAGFSAICYVFLDAETGLANRDSRGSRNLIAPGGLHWTTAGRGIVHEEVLAETGKTAHALQIFVNLPRERQEDQSFTLSLASEDVPVVRMPGARIRVPLGAYRDARSPLTPPTQVSLLDISLEEGAELMVPVMVGHNAFVMPIHGVLTIDGQHFGGEEPSVPLFAAQARPFSITLQARQGNATAVLFAGAPLNQPVCWRGPMAMASAKVLASAFAAHQRGEFGTL